MDSLGERARRWMATDPDPSTRDATRAMLDDDGALREHFGAVLEFGTAGLRGALGPGPNRMNRALVRRVARAVGTTFRPGPIAIGYDGRHGSRAFAEDTAAVLGGLGIPTWLHEDVVPTPVLAHSVTELHCSAGVMVTASHNPPVDNGYKVYGPDGAQIVPPHDAAVAARIEPWGPSPEVAPLAMLRNVGAVRTVPSEVGDAYLRKVLALRVHTETGVRAVYTAMHGVGWQTLSRVLTAAGHTDVHPVPDQRDPDPDFPTVAFPNPEEKGALDRALALAAEVGADLVVANDPDADRLAVALPSPSGWRALTGNQVGCLLADDLLRNGRSGLVATTIVSSTLLSRLAREYDVPYAETLTGFKWIASAAMRHPGPFVMGYEEALGYSVGDVVRDKDGISAALLLLDLAAWSKARGETLWDRLRELYARHGLHASRQHSLVLPGSEGKARIGAMMADLRSRPPERIGGVPVARARDLAKGDEGLPPSNVLAWDLGDGSRVLARPSGTEPKLKLYFEVVAPFSGSIEQAETVAAARLDALVRAMREQLGDSC